MSMILILNNRFNKTIIRTTKERIPVSREQRFGFANLCIDVMSDQ